jgi:hypothetical protein
MSFFKEKRHIKGSHERSVQKLKRAKKSFLLREGTDCCEVIVDGTCYVYSTSTRFPISKLFLFNLVKRDATAFLEAHENVFLPEEYPTAYYNEDYEDEEGTIIGFDINHAYWRIAYNLGIITEHTYRKGLGTDCKAVRLAALSTLGRQKAFKQFKDGGQLDEYLVTQSKTEDLARLYTLIRFSCFEMMHDAAVILGDDFDAWKTDCIYFRDTPQNRESMNEFFSKKGLTYKVLEV